MLAGIFPKLNLVLFPAFLPMVSLAPSSVMPKPTLVFVSAHFVGEYLPAFRKLSRGEELAV